MLFFGQGGLGEGDAGGESSMRNANEGGGQDAIGIGRGQLRGGAAIVKSGRRAGGEVKGPFANAEGGGRAGGAERAERWDGAGHSRWQSFRVVELLRLPAGARCPLEPESFARPGSSESRARVARATRLHDSRAGCRSRQDLNAALRP